MLISIALTILGLGVLIFSGDILVKAASKIAYIYHVSPLIIGLTIVSFGTSAPELFISLKAALNNNPDIAMGNIIGSNLANIGLILGITIIIMAMPVNTQTIKLDWPKLMLSTLLLAYFIQDGSLDFWEGIILLTSSVCFTLWLIYKSIKDRKKTALQENQKDLPGGKTENVFRWFSILVLSCVGLSFGSDWFLMGATGLAELMNISQHTIGITVVAFGTSVPELVTSVIAAVKKESDISIGNLIGSNIFNIDVVLGITSIITPIAVHPNIYTIDIWWVLGIAAILLPLFLTGRVLGKFKGILLISIYCTYIFLLLF